MGDVSAAASVTAGAAKMVVDMDRISARLTMSPVNFLCLMVIPSNLRTV